MTGLPVPKGDTPSAPAEDIARRQVAAGYLGAERRRLFLAGTLTSIVAPTLLYLAGAWEAAWYTLAMTNLPLAVRVAIFLVGVYPVLSVIALPFAYYGGYVLAHAFGLSRQTRGAWARDWLVGTVLVASLGALAGGGFLWCATRFGDNWWWAFGIIITVGMPLSGFLLPYVVVPLFFRARPLADPALAERVKQLVNRAGVDVREVCALDFSRRTSEANAAVIGLGASRRVVLADTLLASFPPDEVDAVVAHELAHQVHRDVPRFLLGQLALAWLGLAVAAVLVPRALPLLSVPHLAYVPAFPALLSVVELYFFLAAPLVSWWSRRAEVAADRFALRLTGNPGAFAGAMRRFGTQNLIELQPPRWAELLFATHPSLSRRIALADGAAR